MIVFISDGRLGNQIFQYAFLNTIRKEDEYIFCINMNIFLDSFNIYNKKIINISGGRLLNFTCRNILSVVLSELGKINLISNIEEDSTSTNANGYNQTKGLFPVTYVKTGFFQSEAYFDSNYLDFEQKTENIKSADKIINSLPSREKVFVHIRRGDYLDEIYQGKRNISLPKSYFLRAMMLIEEKIANPFYVFLTDDYDFVQETYRDIDNKYISQESMLTDLAIMSKCKYGIVSNSSFSWWGAYLSKNKNLMVFPKYWYGWKQKIDSHQGIQPLWGKIVDPN